MPDIDFIRADIEHRRRQVQRLRADIRELQHSGISSTSAEALLERMLSKIDELCAERDRLKKEQPGHNKGKVVGGQHW
jgi:phage shock protein A